MYFFPARLVANAALLSARLPPLSACRLFLGCIRQSDVIEAERFLSQLGRERKEPNTSIPSTGAPVPREGWNPMLTGAGNTHTQLP